MFILKNNEFPEGKDAGVFEYLVGCKQIWKAIYCRPEVAKRYARINRLEPVSIQQWCGFQ